MKPNYFSALTLLLFAITIVNAEFFMTPDDFRGDYEISARIVADPLRPNSVVSGQVRIFAEVPYEASSILLSLSCVESVMVTKHKRSQTNGSDDFKMMYQNTFSLPSNESLSTETILERQDTRWASESRMLFQVSVFLDINRTEPLLKESLFPFHLVVPNVNFPPDLVGCFGTIPMGDGYSVVYGYKVTLFNETGKRSFKAGSTPFYPVVSIPQTDSINPLKVMHTFEPKSYGQTIKVSEVGIDMVAILAAGDTYVAGDTIFMSVTLTPNITTKPAPKIFSLSASVMQIQYNRLVEDVPTYGTLGIFDTPTFSCNEAKNITLGEPFTLAIQLDKVKYPGFNLTYIQLSHYLQLILTTQESIWTVPSMERMKIPIRIASQKYSGIEDPIHYSRGSTQPYFVSAEEVISTTPMERDQAAPVRGPDVVHQSNQPSCGERYPELMGWREPFEWNHCY